MLKNFRAYQLSKELYFQCEKLRVKDFLKLQLLRASSSICLNLAEGSGKLSKKDQRRFYSIAMGSLREVQAILEISNSPQEAQSLANKLGGLVFKLIYRG